MYMMEIFNNIVMLEHEKASEKEIQYIKSLIDKSYNEWRKISRRINAVDIITTTVNRISKVQPYYLDKLNIEDKAKLALILMRCMDNPTWKSIDSKAKIYDKLFPLIVKLQNFKVNTGTQGTLKEIICTRLSASLAVQDKDNNDKIAVVYEPVFSEKYKTFLFGSLFKPNKIYRMQTLSLPSEFNNLIDLLKINLDKAKSKYKKSNENDK